MSSLSGLPWTKADLFFLEDALRRGMSSQEVAGFLGRTAGEVRAKAHELVLTQNERPVAQQQPDVRRLAGIVQEAPRVLEAWPEALKSITEAAGVAGAGYIVYNKTIGSVEFACFSGLSAGLESKYIQHYSALDPFLPMLRARWRKLSYSIPEHLLRTSEWYNDFVLRCGVRDIIAARLADGASISIIFGLQQQIGRTFSDKTASVLKQLDRSLRVAARGHAAHLSLSLPGE
jgi:hypothetical protein